MKVVTPANGDKNIYIDDGDYDTVKPYRWFVHKRRNYFYAYTWIKGKHLYMHRLLMNPRPHEQIDHANQNGLDNRRENMRVCTPSENQANKQPIKGSSIFRGVSWNKEAKKWRVQITVNDRRKHLGYFHDEISAAKAYDVAAHKHFGEFARLNFPARKEDALTLLM